jgi:hypothetical protein
MISLNASLIGDTELFSDLRAKVSDPERLAGYVAASLAVGTRNHIMDAAKTRHRTAEALGAEPSGYLERKAGTVESRVVDGVAQVTIAGEREIFARALGRVTITPRASKYLTLPCHPDAYGMRARELADLKVFFITPGHLLNLRNLNALKVVTEERGEMDMGKHPLALGYINASSTGDKREVKVGRKYYTAMYLLALKTILTSDRRLLPDEAQIAERLELAAADFIDLEDETSYV